MAAQLLYHTDNKGTNMRKLMTPFLLKPKNTLKVVLILMVASLLTACGSSKSTATSGTEQSSNRFDINSQKAMAHCNKSVDANFSFNTASVIDDQGRPSTEWIKLKFNFINAEITKPGNVIKFFKWRVANGQAVLDETPLMVSAYDPTTGQTVSSNHSGLAAEQVNGVHRFYVNLADANGLFQVLKVVAYNSEGKIVGNLNSLIPTFYASPMDYQFNSDGTARATILQDMHTLRSVAVAGWTPAQYTEAFNAFCF